MHKRTEKMMMDRLFKAAFDIQAAGNQLNHLANDIRKGVSNNSTFLLDYINKITIPMLRKVWNKEAVDDLVKLIKEATKQKLKEKKECQTNSNNEPKNP